MRKLFQTINIILSSNFLIQIQKFNDQDFIGALNTNPYDSKNLKNNE